MIEKLKEHDVIDPKTDKVIGKIGCDLREIMDKLNEVIDWINDVSALRVTDKQITANLPNIDAGELAFLSKENTELKDEIDRLETELERTRKELEIAIDALNKIALVDDAGAQMVATAREALTKIGNITPR